MALSDDWTRLGETTVLAVSAEHEGVAKATLTTSRTDLVLLMHSENDAPWCVVTPSLCPVADAPSSSPLELCAGRPGRS